MKLLEVVAEDFLFVGEEVVFGIESFSAAGCARNGAGFFGGAGSFIEIVFALSDSEEIGGVAS